MNLPNSEMAAVGSQLLLIDGDGEGGDILETVFSRVPLIDLVSASHVSKSWRRAVSSSLRRTNRPRPWLILHSHTRRPPYAMAALAYDPRSKIWIGIPRPETEPASPPLKSSHSNFLYILSSSRLSFSDDPLNFNWRHVRPPQLWRMDPIVARVGNSVVVAGGGCDFGDDPLAVEIYDLDAHVWRTCHSMPGALRDTAASRWLSIAATAERLIVTDKESGSTHWFDPATKSWSGPFNLDPGRPGIGSYNIGCLGNGSLILIGLCRTEIDDRIGVWMVGDDDFECVPVGEMPPDFVEKLRGESFRCSSIGVRAAGNTVYVYNCNAYAAEVVACELAAGGGLAWWSVRSTAAITESTAVTCSEVGIEELERVMRAATQRFQVDAVS
ncbi:F-box/kelch-repeat protein At1g23390 [Andrographis paniculata]|uniref:F-box/kelch-repeat protein At1g23390 n=1 Tax=Andrographis paniculata TaxID=175694 RepID=UPI0021E76EF7|nr:F-box/kelch-repeat protein At1g23390 [Andrographis paniculata]